MTLPRGFNEELVTTHHFIEKRSATMDIPTSRTTNGSTAAMLGIRPSMSPKMAEGK
jgi:hypothetical protein